MSIPRNGGVANVKSPAKQKLQVKICRDGKWYVLGYKTKNKFSWSNLKLWVNIKRWNFKTRLIMLLEATIKWLRS